MRQSFFRRSCSLWMAAVFENVPYPYLMISHMMSAPHNSSTPNSISVYKISVNLITGNISKVLAVCLRQLQCSCKLHWLAKQGEYRLHLYVYEFNSYRVSHDNWCTVTLWNRIMTAQCEGMWEVGSARYEPALLPPCPSIRVLCYSNCQRSTHASRRAWQCKC